MISENELKEICFSVGEKLSILQDEKNGIITENNLRLIYPRKKNPSKEAISRISEQETRVLFCQKLEDKKFKDIYYSIETPTSNKYKIKLETPVLKGGQSGSIDTTIFSREGKSFTREINIEFKHKNASVHAIGKDLLKLMHEPPSGLFFHTLKSMNRGTLSNKDATGVLDKYIEKTMTHKDKWESIDNNKFILFVICILYRNNRGPMRNKNLIILMKTLRKNDLENKKSIANFFQIDYSRIIKGPSRDTLNGWEKRSI